MSIPQEYLVLKFNQLAGGVKYKPSANSYYGSCNICKEGKSWLKKKRLYYVLSTGVVYCHNCGYSKSAVNYVIDSTGMTFKEIAQEAKDFDYVPNSIEEDKTEVEKKTLDPLPKDHIDLLNKSQVEFYKEDPVVKDAILFLIKRRLVNAINRPKSFFLSLNDPLHKNRIVVPHFDTNGKIVHYQSRALYNKTEFDNVRYLSKVGSDKTIFNIDRVTDKSQYIYVFEGAFNSCFVENGVAVSGISTSKQKIFTDKQEEQLRNFPFHELILVLDNQWVDDTALEKSIYMAEKGYKIFVWPKQFIQFKDFNDIAIAGAVNSIKTTFIHQHMKSGAAAIEALIKIKNERQTQ